MTSLERRAHKLVDDFNMAKQIKRRILREKIAKKAKQKQPKKKPLEFVFHKHDGYETMETVRPPQEVRYQPGKVIAPSAPQPAAKSEVEEFDVHLPNAEQLKSISALVKEATVLMRRIEKGEELLKSLKGELHTINTRILPDALASAGTTEFKTDDGCKVTIRPFVSGSLPKDEEERRAALEWIEKEGASDIIKNMLNFNFDRGKDKLAEKIKMLADKMGLEYESKRDVHAQTLAAFARERMKEGKETPLDMLGLTAGRMAKITIG